MQTDLTIRRRDLLRTLAALGAGACGLPATQGRGQEPADPVSRKPEWITPETQKAIDAGLAFLARSQIKSGRDQGALGTNGYSGGVAVAALAGLAFMGSGDPPGQGPYGQHVERCVGLLIRNTQDNGYITVQGSNDRMYGHGFATLCLAQALGMSRNRDLRDKVKKAVALIVGTQNSQGGWRYMPDTQSADLSVTICQIMALRAAAEGGLSVPKRTRERAIQYVKQSQRSDGAFMYTIPQGHVTLALTAAGLVSLYSAGIYEGRPIERGLAWMMQYVPGAGAVAQSHNYFYTHYYAVQAAWHAGGQNWERWYPAIRNELLRSRNRTDGTWTDPIGVEYATAMACIILQMPNNSVPIFAE